MSESQGITTEHYGSADQVRAMLGQPDLSTEEIDGAARSLGWPSKSPHPFLVSERVEKRQRR